jgi:3-oxoacyl-[acyl-carrier-protein] synthase II
MIDSNIKRVVVTGLGALAPNGLNAAQYFNALLQGKNTIERLTRFDATPFKSQMAAEVKDFNPRNFGMKGAELSLDRSNQFGLIAFREALKNSKLNSQNANIYLGMTVSGVDSAENGFEDYRLNKRVPKKFWDLWLPENALAAIAEDFAKIQTAQLLSTGCTSGTDAIGLGFESIKHNLNQTALCGGTEAPITPLCYMAFCAMGALSTRNDDPTHASRPFDAKRTGFIFGEGAAALVLEELEHAQERGAPILAEVVGYGTTLSAHHMNRPDPEGVESAKAIRLAIDEAGIVPEELGYIAYHGSSTQLNEKSETNAVKKALGKSAYRVPGSSIKSMIGHPLGSAGALQAVAAVMALQSGWLPPTINYEFPDPDCDLDYIPNVARKKDIEYALVNSSGFGGKNSALILKKFG